MQKLKTLMVGTGEYTTGYVGGQASTSDKGAGVVALTMFDLRAKGRLGELFMAGTNGTKFPGIREHLGRCVKDRYGGMDISFGSFPSDTVERDAEAYLAGLAKLKPGDLVVVFTPDDTHHRIAAEAVDRGCHVLIAKPIVKTLNEHLELTMAAKTKGVLVAMEVHKRWDPIYADARDRISRLGDFSFFQSYMSQPKSQLETFRAWAGKSSDISYYLNAHHIDFHNWSVGSFARPVSVVASGATGVARTMGIPTEDTITLTVEWENRESRNVGTAIYTSSWIAPAAEVHSQQRFFYMGHAGEVTIDQAHRGYTLATDADGYSSANPLFMKYEPNDRGEFCGQSGYGYRSIEDFVEAAVAIREGTAVAGDFDGRLATVADTVAVTAILEAGRRSLDGGGIRVKIACDENGAITGLE